ncbi:MAG: formate/nitrite transporter family protein [Eubacteriales bacterium]|jgi:formate/nitrite transporter FocA (FNT family)
MKYFKTFLYGIMGGICISLGGAAFLTSDNKAVGASFFVIGLFVICTMGFNLFTGKICYVFDRKPSYLLDLLLIWLGNFTGAWLSATMLRATRLTGLVETAQKICTTKLGDNYGSIFILAIFCNILIYIAVDGYANNPHELGKYLSLFFGVAIFVFCGFEHCVANMFYISMAGFWGSRAFAFILINTAGNAVGGVIFPIAKKIYAWDAGKAVKMEA